MATLPVWPKPGLNVQKENAPPGIYYTPAEVVERTTYVQRRLDQSDLFDYDPTGVPYYPFIDAQSIVQGRVGTDLDTLRGLYDGATTLTTGRNSEGDGNGANFTWDETSVVARNGTTVFGLGATGRWLQTGTVGGGGGASFTGPSISFTANGTLNTTGIADAAFFAVVPTSDNLIARGLTPPSSGSNINVRKAFNNSNYTIVIPHEDTGASATARFATDDGVSKIWPGKTWMDFSHDATLTRYRVRAQDDALVNGLLVTDLNGIRGRREGEQRFTTGLDDSDDRGGGGWWWDKDATGTTTFESRPATGGLWRRIRNAGYVDIAWLGCKDDGSVDCSLIMREFGNDWATEYGVQSFLKFFVQAVRKNKSGWLFETPYYPPDQVFTAIIGEAPAALNAMEPDATSNMGITRAGSVFEVAPGIKGIWGGVADDQYEEEDAVVRWLYLENIGLIGGGGGIANGVGIYAHVPRVNFEFQSRNVKVQGFEHGVWFRNAVTNVGHYQLWCRGNKTGFRLGGGPKYDWVGENIQPFNLNLRECRAEYSEIGVHVNGCNTALWSGGLIQANELHIKFGNGADTGPQGAGCANFTLDGVTHMEGHGAYDGGDTAIEFGSGGSYNNIVFNQVFCAGLNDLVLPNNIFVTFNSCSMSSDIVTAASARWMVNHPDWNGGFNAITHDANSIYTPPNHINTEKIVVVPAGGLTYTHNWGADGTKVYFILCGPLTVNVPTNAPRDAPLEMEFQQHPDDFGAGVGLHAVTFHASILEVDWSNIGNIGNGLSSIGIHFNSGTWKQKTPQRRYFNKTPIDSAVTASTTQTQGQQRVKAPTTRVTTVANANDVITLPPASDVVALGAAGILVTNEGGGNALQIFPAAGGDVGAGTNASTTLAAGASARFIALSSTRLLKL